MLFVPPPVTVRTMTTNQRTQADVQRATPDDLGDVATTLARAFADDPVMRWLAAPRDERYRRTGPAAFAALLRTTYMAKAEIYMAGNGQAAVIWVPPDAWKAPISHTIRVLPAYVALSGRRIPRLLKLITAMEKRHEFAEEPHWYIPFIGAVPERQGEGLGSALLAHVLAYVDDEGRPTYLEASSPRNQLLYHRHGFEAQDEVRVAGSPPLTVMWRRPR